PSLLAWEGSVGPNAVWDHLHELARHSFVVKRLRNDPGWADDAPGNRRYPPAVAIGSETSTDPGPRWVAGNQRHARGAREERTPEVTAEHVRMDEIRTPKESMSTSVLPGREPVPTAQNSVTDAS